jgi:non-ribosomal peptide synthetase component E (peptide arylation enzyme)
MRGDDELRVADDQLVQPGDHGQLAVRGERCFRLVENVEAIAQKRLTNSAMNASPCDCS